MANKRRPAPKGWLWSADAADYISVGVTTLYRWRRDRIGPPSKQHGPRRYAYRIADLDQWLDGDSPELSAPAA